MLVMSYNKLAGRTAPLLVKQSNLRFQGQQYDEETGLHYNRHRYYDPSQGRYLSLDPIGLAGGDNLVGYVYGNPVMLVDPTGLQSFPGSGTISMSDMSGQAVMSTSDVMIGQSKNQATWDAKGSPDYVVFALDAYVASISVTYTRYGDVFMGGGVNRAFPHPWSVGSNISSGYLMCAKRKKSGRMESGRPEAGDLNNFLTGWGASAAGGYDVAGAAIVASREGVAVNIGLGIGGAGVSPGTVSHHLGNIGDAP